MSRNFELMRNFDREQDSLHKGTIPSLGTNGNHESRTLWSPPVTQSTTSEVARLLGVCRKHGRLSAICAATIFIFVVLGTLMVKPDYEPVARLQVDPPGSEAFSLDKSNFSSTEADYVDTQVQNLTNDDMAIAVIRTLHLDLDKEFTHRSLMSRLLGFFSKLGSTKQESERPGLTDSENRALMYLNKNLRVQRNRNTLVVDVSFASHNPRTAALVANTLVNLYIDGYYKSRYDAIMQSSKWLSRQLDDIRQKMESSNQALTAYQKNSRIVDVDDKQSTFTQTVGELNRQLTQAQVDRIQLQSYLSRVGTGSEDALPEVRDNPVIHELTQKTAETRSELSQALAVYGLNHPAVQKLQSQANELQSQLTAQKKNIVEALKTSYTAARAREEMMTSQMKGVTEDMSRMAQYNALKKDAQANSDLYNALYARVKEAGIAAASRSSNFRIVDEARILNSPTRPRWLLNLGVGFLAAIVFGVMTAFAKEGLDAMKIQTPEDVKNWTGLPAMSIMPLIASQNEDKRSSTFLLKRPDSPESEAVRALYTSIAFSNGSKFPRIILIASPFPRDGKTLVASNLAMAFAQHGKTCLLDADLRKASASTAMGLKSRPGVSEVFAGKASLQEALVNFPELPELWILPAGGTPTNPGEIVISNRMRELVRTLSDSFSYVIIDSAPIIPYADGRALSSLVDGVVLVGRCGSTTNAALTRSVELLNEAHATVLGVVLNGVDFSSAPYRNYGYSGSPYAG